MSFFFFSSPVNTCAHRYIQFAPWVGIRQTQWHIHVRHIHKYTENVAAMVGPIYRLLDIHTEPLDIIQMTGWIIPFFFFIIVPKRCADYLKACWTWLVWPSLAQRLEADGNPDPKLSQSVRCIYQNARHYLERNSLTFFWNAVILFLKKFTWGLMSLWCLDDIFSSKWKVKLNTPTSHTRMT